MKIELFPRIHLTLIDFLANGYRKFGGIGFSINRPKITICVKETSDFDFKYWVNGVRLDVSDVKLNLLIKNISESKDFQKRALFEIEMDCLPHTGFGTGTNLTLACLEALFILNNREYDKQILTNLAKRGRTSGIGIQTYFSGGFVFDIGVRNIDNIFLPSNCNESELIASPLFCSRTPEWNILVCIPKFLSTITRDEERIFFTKNTPMSEEDVFVTLYHSVFGVAASIIEEDFDTFCKSIKTIQDCKWKFLERSNYGVTLYEIEDALYKAGANAVAMSSLGPTLIAFSLDFENFYNSAKMKMQDKAIILNACCNNTGRIIYA